MTKTGWKTLGLLPVGVAAAAGVKITVTYMWTNLWPTDCRTKRPRQTAQCRGPQGLARSRRSLLGGPFRTKMRMYTGQGPRNMLDKASCRDWMAEMKASKAGWTAFKLGPPGGFGGGDGERPQRTREATPGQEPPNGFARPAQNNRVYSRKQLIDNQQGFENVREAIGWERDVMFHGQWNYDFLAAIQLSQPLETVKPLWIEDPLPPEFSNAWVRLTEASKVPILTGENLGRRQDWMPFFEQKGIHIGQLDVRNTGGLLESKKIADLADVHLIPMCAHDTASIVCNYGVLHWACAVRGSSTPLGGGLAGPR